MANLSSSPFSGYDQVFEDLKERIRTAQVKATLSVNNELISLYWDIGKEIVAKQETAGWGDAVLEKLSLDLKKEFSTVQGFSRRNLYRMRALYLAYRHLSEFVPQAVAQIPWGHNIFLLEKLKNPDERLWYAAATTVNGWSRNVLALQIGSKLHERQGKAITNFAGTLPTPQSDLAQNLLKDPYNFDFLTLATDARERELEMGLTEHIRQFLLELGIGFAFVGSQVKLEVGGDDFYLDLLFYHLKLRCYVVIDLKMGEFTPEFAGKMNFYLSSVDDLLRHTDDQPSIGLILCKTKNQIVAEYALRDMNKPIGVSGYQITESLPDDLRPSLPTVEELEAGLEDS